MKTINSFRSKLFALTLALMASVSSFAYDFQNGYLFYNILDDGTVAVTSARYGFPYDYLPASLIIPSEVIGYNGETYIVTEIANYAFQGSDQLESVVIPNTVRKIGMYAFTGCSKLVDISFPESLEDVLGGALYECAWYNNQPDGLVYVGNLLYRYKGTAPAGTIVVRDGTKAILDFTFSNQPNIQSVILPESVTSIHLQAFGECNNLTTLVLPASIQKIERQAFENCTSLTEVTCYATIPPVIEEPESPSDWIFAGVDVANILLYVPAQSLGLYKNAEHWKEFKIRPYYSSEECDEYKNVNLSVVLRGKTSLSFYLSNNHTIEPPYVDSVWIFDTEFEPLKKFYAQSGDTIDLSFLEETGTYILQVYINGCILSRAFVYRIIPNKWKDQWCDTWNVLMTNSSLGPDEQKTTYRYQLAQDTVIGEQTYSVLTRYWTAEPDSKKEYLGAVRFANDRKVYANYNGKEYLVYDFSAEVGDTIEALIGVEYYGMTHKYLVHNKSIDPETNRTTITLHVYDEYRGEFIDDFDFKWIEGVGATSGFYEGRMLNEEGGGATHLLCAYQGDELKYTGPLYDKYGCEYNANDPQLPLVDWCNQWNILAHGYLGPREPLYGAKTTIYQLGEDTIINHLRYKQLTRYASDDVNQTKTYVGAIRFTKNNRQIYFYYDNAEYLLYDFKAQVGDTLEVFAGIDNYKYHKTYKHVVTNKEPIEDEQTKVTLEVIVTEEFEGNIYEEKFTTTWMEGVGSPDGIVHNHATQFAGSIITDLLCAYVDDRRMYRTNTKDPFGIDYTQLGCVYNDGDFIEGAFPMLSGLQRTICKEYYGETEDDNSANSTYKQTFDQIFFENDKPYILCNDYLLREEDNKILIYSQLLNKDLVLYDFTLEVGDSLPALYIDYHARNAMDWMPYNLDVVDYYKSFDGTIYPADTFIVTDISNVTLFDGKEYKKWTFNNVMEYVEGIGSFGNRQWSGDFFQLIANRDVPTSLQGEHLVCVSKNNKLLYQMDEEEMERLGTECLCAGYLSSYKDQWCDTWNVLMTNSSLGPDEQKTTYRYQLAQDIVIGDYTYTTVVSKAINDALDAPRYVAAVRFTDDRKVYIYYDNAEYLLYDFNVQEGEELEVFAGINNYTSEIKTYKCTVTGVEQYACVGCPATITLEVHNHPDDFREFYRQTQWIEGVGDINGFLNGINGYINIPGNAAEYLLCAYQGDELKYTGDLYEEYGCGDDAEQSPEDLFPTLWGLQRTDLELHTTEDGKPYHYAFDEYVPTMVNGKWYLYDGRNYLREENNQVLLYAPDTEIYEDIVLYDWTLEVGDTLPRPNISVNREQDYIVTDVSTITLLDGKEYKKWTLACGYEYIESIGAIKGHGYGLFLCLPHYGHLGTYIHTRLVCASRNGQLLYQMDDTEIERLGTECLCDYNSGPKKDNAKDGKIGGRPTPTQWNQLEIVLREMDVWSAETFSYTLEDNSQVVNNRNYFDLARQSTKDTAVTKSVIGALHFGQNEDNRVYFLCDGHEYVLYDFTAEVGDTLQIFAGINNYPQDSVYTHVVTSKKTSDDGVCQMWLEVVFPDEANATIDNAQKVWEAGLGSLDGIVHNAAKRASNARSSETEASIMLCAWREDDCLYTTTHLDFDGYDYGCVYNQEPTSIKDVLAPTSAKKILRDGRMYIYTNGTIYTIIGQKVSENF